MKQRSFFFLCLLLPGLRALSGNYTITDFGAKGDGVTVNTKQIQQAMLSCRDAGGGTVIVPTGIFVTGTLYLYSNIELHLESGAVLLGSGNLADYVPASPVHLGMIYAENASHITISGEGTIDANGDVFFERDKAKRIDSAGTVYTRQKEHFREVKEGIGDGPWVPKDRPYQQFIFSNCRMVTIKDIFITRSAFWTMHFADCDAVNVTGIRLWTNMMAPNADGIDITSCTNVHITGCDIRTGDDAIAIVGYDHHFEIPGFQHLRHLSENITVTDCHLESSSSGIRIGFLDQNTVRNVQVSQVSITNSTRGIGIFLRDQGSLENLIFSDITIDTHLRTGDWWGNGEPIHISAIRGKDSVPLGKIRHVQFNNIICRGENGLLLYGTPESMLEDISFDHIRMELTDSKLNEVAGGNIDLRGVSGVKNGLFARDLPGLLIRYARGVSIRDLTLVWTGARMPFFTHGIELDHFSDVLIRDFQGGASPANKKAWRIFAQDGTGLTVDDHTGLMTANVK